MSEPARRPGIPRAVIALGVVSLCMDMGSEMMHAVLPAFLMGTLGAGPAFVGLIDGVAEGTASIFKVFSGRLSDRIGKRKPVALAGYGLSALVRPLFPLATTPALVLGARFLDRVGKGVRGAPRDALVADVTPPERRGEAYGLRQTLDNIGAILGPLIAAALLASTHEDVRTVLRLAVVPAVLAVAVLAVGVEEPSTHTQGKTPPRLSMARGLGGTFWLSMVAVTLLAFARYGESMLLVRGLEAGMSKEGSAMLLAEMSAVYALSSWPAGQLSDRVGRTGLLVAGLGAFVVSNLVLSQPGIPAVLVGIALWGLHLGLTQGVLSSLVADTVPVTRRGEAFGVFHLLQGVSAAVGGGLLGLLWEDRGAPWALGLSAALALLAAPVLLRLHRALAARA